MSPEESLSLIFLGAFAGEENLRKEWKKLKGRYRIKNKAYFADQKTLQALNIRAQLTPQLITVTKRHKSHFLGLQNCKDFIF